MINPADLIDRELYARTPFMNKILKRFVDTYGKICTYYINPNHESSENNQFNDIDSSTKALRDDVSNSHQRLDNYTLAFGKNKVGYNYDKLQKVEARIVIMPGQYYVHDIGGDTSINYYIQVEGTPVMRGDIISFVIQDKQLFYRITEKVKSFFETIYDISCNLIQVKQLGGGKRVYEIHHPRPDYMVFEDGGMML